MCLYTVGTSDNGAFGAKAGTASADKAGNALANEYTHTHTATLTLDTTNPGIAFPPSPAVPRVGVASTITLTDAGAKIKKYGAIMVDGTTGAATDCDTATEIGTSNVTTLTTPDDSVAFAYTVPAGSVGKKVCAYAEDEAGNIKSALWSAAAQAAPTGPAISSIAITSSVPANQNGHYRIGDAIEVTVTFDKALTVTGTPKLKIKVGTAEKEASCAKKGTTGDDAKTLVCTYTVSEGDADANGIAVEAGKLTGTITDGTMAANLNYTAIADSASHKVDGVKPTVTQASTGYFSNAAATTALTGPQKSGTSIYTKVTFSENMTHVNATRPRRGPSSSTALGPPTRSTTSSTTGTRSRAGTAGRTTRARPTSTCASTRWIPPTAGPSPSRPARTASTRRATRWRTPTPTPRRSPSTTRRRRSRARWRWRRGRRAPATTPRPTSK